MNSFIQLLTYGTLDLNSFFASVEQCLRPELRGRPVAVVPVEKTDATCAIAASYEAKAFGVKTGTMIGEARRLCPELVCVLANHEHYLDFHKRIEEEVEKLVPIIHVGSIDEFTYQLPYRQRSDEEATALSQAVKDRIREKVGMSLTSSVGLSENRFLSKIGSNYQKPDGLTILRARDVPIMLSDHPVEWLTGIAGGLRVKLARAGITRVGQLYCTEPKRLRAVWGSVEGERFWYKLHGYEIPLEETQRRTVGHSHVIAPEQRHPELAYIVMQRLLLKAASRLRRMDYLCGAMEISVRLVHGPRDGVDCRFPPTCENFSLLPSLRRAWEVLMVRYQDPMVKKVSVTLHKLVDRESSLQMELFAEAADARSPESLAKEQLCRVMDSLNQKFGRDAVVQGFTPMQAKGFTGTKIAFTRVPEKHEFRE